MRSCCGRRPPAPRALHAPAARRALAAPPGAAARCIADPPPAGPHAVQLAADLLRASPPVPLPATASGHRPGVRPRVPAGDQYLGSEPVARGIAAALEGAPELRLVAVVPRFPAADGRISGPPNRLGQLGAMELLQQGRPPPFR